MDREKERQIVIKGREMGKSDDFIKEAVLRYRSQANAIQATSLQPIQQVTPTGTTFGQKVLNAGTAVANFIGAKGISDQFGADIARARVPEEQKNLVEYPKMRSVLGSAAQTGANLVPGAGVGAKIATKVGIGAATGYAIDAGSKLQDEQKSTARAFIPGLSTVINTALPVLGRITGLSNGVKFNKNVANKLEEINLRLTPLEKQNLQKQGKQVADYLASKKIVGSPSQRYLKVNTLYEEMENKVQEAISGAGVKLKLNGVTKSSGVKFPKSELINEIKQLPEQFADDIAAFDEVKRTTETLIKFLQNKAPDEITGELLNKYKRQLFKRAYSKNNTDIVNESYNAVGGLFKSKLDKAVPALASLNDEYGKLITARKALFKATSRNQAGIIGRAAGLVAGTSVGATLAGPGGAAVGAFVAPQVVNSVSTPLRSVTGATFQSLSNAINKIPLDERGRLLITRKALLQLLNQQQD